MVSTWWGFWHGCIIDNCCNNDWDVAIDIAPAVVDFGEDYTEEEVALALMSLLWEDGNVDVAIILLLLLGYTVDDVDVGTTSTCFIPEVAAAGVSTKDDSEGLCLGSRLLKLFVNVVAIGVQNDAEQNSSESEYQLKYQPSAYWEVYCLEHNSLAAYSKEKNLIKFIPFFTLAFFCVIVQIITQSSSLHA